ncbi:MAG: DNA repair protein RecO [Phycisphaerales bacterium]|nr:DNA repair protein RecO [Phycisphaerales bacterium]
MLVKTKAIVLRRIKYGDTSLIVNLFTEQAGLQSYMLKGVRSDKIKHQRTGLLQIASLLEVVAEHKPNRQLQQIKEFQPAYIYQSVQEEIVKNSIATFSVELLQKLLPKEENVADFFQFVYDFFILLDAAKNIDVGNFPLFFTIQCGKYLGYHVLGNYSEQTPYLNAIEGIFSSQSARFNSGLSDDDVKILGQLFQESDIQKVQGILLNASTRNRLLDWHIQFLQHHTQHLGVLRSLDILRAILH